MESRAFIREAAVLIKDLEDFTLMKSLLNRDRGEEQEQGLALEKRVTNLFVGLQNPTLPSAYNLRDAALAAGCFVDPKVQHRLATYEVLRD